MNSNKSSSQDDSKKPRNRVGHNEYERKRRVAQRSMLEELQSVLPISSNNKTSMAGVVVQARDYILELKRRIAKLETILVTSNTPPDSSPFNSSLIENVKSKEIKKQPTKTNLPPPPPSHPPKIPIQPINKMSQVTVANDAQKFNSDNDEKSSISKSPNKIQFAPLISSSPDKASYSSISDTSPAAILSNLTLSAAFNSNNRRKSSILMPTPFPNTVFLGKRDSFSGFITSLFNTNDLNTNELSVINEATPNISQMLSTVRCGICDEEAKSMIMIDCDACSNWYHIECVNIAIINMPLNWTCSKCTFQHSKSLSNESVTVKGRKRENRSIGINKSRK